MIEVRISLFLDFQQNTDSDTILTAHHNYEGEAFWFVII